MIDASAVFCDALTVTVPLDQWESLPGDLGDVFNSASLELQHQDEGREIWATPRDTGIVRLQRHAKARVVSVYASGAALGRLRFAKLFGQYLHVLAQRPHKVTRLDASADVACDAPPVVVDVRDRGRAGLVSLTRKAVAPASVEFWERLRPDGRISGSVYLAKTADVSLLVYDKRLERFDNSAREWDGLDERVRFELRVRNGQPTLADAYAPAPLFFQHMAPSVVPRPADVPSRPHNGFGFSVERGVPALPAARLQARVESSTDLGELCLLAARDRAGGLPYLLRLVRDRYQAEVIRASEDGVKGPMAPSRAPSGCFPAAWLDMPSRAGSESGGSSALR